MKVIMPANESQLIVINGENNGVISDKCEENVYVNTM
jgi:hypothetical protein